MFRPDPLCFTVFAIDFDKCLFIFKLIFLQNKRLFKEAVTCNCNLKWHLIFKGSCSIHNGTLLSLFFTCL